MCIEQLLCLVCEFLIKHVEVVSDGSVQAGSLKNLALIFPPETSDELTSAMKWFLTKTACCLP